jgi:DNA invertase Pin-like site-specific DNA recombinase
MQGCHGDGDPSNNAVGNLRWDTPKGNHADRIRHGTNCPGEANGSAKLSADQVTTIRERAATGERHGEIAKDFGVHRPTVSRIVRGASWKHLTLEVNNGGQ